MSSALTFRRGRSPKIAEESVCTLRAKAEILAAMFSGGGAWRWREQYFQHRCSKHSGNWTEREKTRFSCFNTKQNKDTLTQRKGRAWPTVEGGGVPYRGAMGREGVSHSDDTHMTPQGRPNLQPRSVWKETGSTDLVVFLLVLVNGGVSLAELPPWGRDRDRHGRRVDAARWRSVRDDTLVVQAVAVCKTHDIKSGLATPLDYWRSQHSESPSLPLGVGGWLLTMIFLSYHLSQGVCCYK